ncbi:IclR family transcriptional regulator [Nocardia sp. NPDC052254]|uniref:IclR family transcriptional regulator n=1 Tax=Nocardia sp. NPDC052254 TaxID=3155681 RepID=UPI003414E83B
MTVVDSDSVVPSEITKGDLPPSMVERMTLILDAFDGPMEYLSLEEVASRTALPRSTVHRILDKLVRLHWIDRVSSGYRLGRRALGLGGGDGGHAQLRAAAAPLLHELHLRTGMVVHLSVLDGGETVYLDKVGGRFAASVPSRVGGRKPAYATAGGKAVLAWMAAEQVDTLYRNRLSRCTEVTISDVVSLHQELNRIRRRSGVAFERDEAVRGVSCVGVAVRGLDGPVAGISLCGDSHTAQLERVAPLLARAGRDISSTLNPESGTPRRGRTSVPPPEDSWSTAALDRLLAIQSGQWL